MCVCGGGGGGDLRPPSPLIYVRAMPLELSKSVEKSQTARRQSNESSLCLDHTTSEADLLSMCQAEF